MEEFIRTPRGARPTVRWVLAATAIFYALSILILIACLWIPSINTGKYQFVIILDSESFRLWYYRGNKVYNTAYLPLSNLIYYTLMNLLGYPYVNCSNLNFFRKHLLHSKHGNNNSFYTTLAVSPVLFMLSSIIVLTS